MDSRAFDIELEDVSFAYNGSGPVLDGVSLSVPAKEFLVVLAETSLHQAATIAERMRLALAAKPIAAAGLPPFSITASIGVAAHRGHPDENYLIKAADDALYRAKQNGRNRVEQDRRGA